MTSEESKLYGIGASSLNEAKKKLSRAVSMEFTLHDSLYRGGDYYRWRGQGSAEMILQRNFADDDGVLTEPDYPSYPFLLYVTDLNVTRSDGLSRSGAATLLQSVE